MVGELGEDEFVVGKVELQGKHSIGKDLVKSRVQLLEPLFHCKIVFVFFHFQIFPLLLVAMHSRDECVYTYVGEQHADEEWLEYNVL